MFENQTNTAVLLFALSASEESKYKHIQKGGLLFHVLTGQTLSEVKKAGLPYFHFDEKLQKGSSFGERFSNAIQNLFDKGFKNVIALGNDCPQITRKHIQSAALQLSSGQNVIAPSKDGGFNLLGIQRDAFGKQDFEQLPWQTEQLLSKTLVYFGQRGQQPKLLRVFSDIDTVADIAFLLKTVRSFSNRLRNVLMEVLQTVQHHWLYSFRYTNLAFFALPFNKGSPLSLPSH
ncbi:DUF2064 domain-containing protein [Muricauda sp. SCSIO 64092]|uniref:TIGR04282 family arsenosugar biosynthesis glycosyltransferase n=1 Tax=Allomuricauda sp. SCSIO 64092 TaxID=2908842 RepID=UPI001FF29C03|nr:DUF2064 domain-containing protein [Muricauda sp. SCSIO 64092]UOY08812.1 DUF2064 domain-containing protein [Muricauda sp. SCSIO 64092]